MKLINYIKDKSFTLIISFITSGTIFALLLCLNINTIISLLIVSIYLISFIICILHDYQKKHSFYNLIDKRLNELDKKYLITEMVTDSSFYEGELLLEYLYDIDKSFMEEVNKYKYTNEEFKDYIEMWCHEIKTPIAVSKLIIDNNKNKVTLNILEEINKVENYVEQVLYFARSEIVEKDYIITHVNLKNIVQGVILSNKKSILNKKIKIEVFSADVFVDSDAKWLTYIINQIIINSIKYSKESDAIIRITVINNKNNVLLTIEDNGIGIDSSDIDRIFDKGFTGNNGRNEKSSTGMGLYLCKRLCQKMGHEIYATSDKNIRTVITIVFPISSMIKIDN